MNGNQAWSRITDFAIDARQRLKWDLTVGYPSLKIPRWIRTILSGASSFYDAVGTKYDKDNLTYLRKTVLDILRCNDVSLDQVFVTYTGSISLERCVSAFDDERRHITLSPEIDIISALSLQVKKQAPMRIGMGPNGFDEPVMEALLQAASGVILLSTPNNPTGNALSEEQIARLGARSARAGGGLILDQCSALLQDGVDAPIAVPHLPPEGDWAVLWDTGKILGLAHEKIAVIIASVSAAPRIERALSLIQYSIATRSLLVFHAILSHPSFSAYLTELKDALSLNYRYARARLSPWYHALDRLSGPFMCLMPRDGVAIDVAGLMDLSSVGMICGEMLFAPSQSPKGYLRLALAREKNYFEAAIDAIVAALDGDLS